MDTRNRSSRNSIRVISETLQRPTARTRVPRPRCSDITYESPHAVTSGGVEPAGIEACASRDVMPISLSGSCRQRPVVTRRAAAEGRSNGDHNIDRSIRLGDSSRRNPTAG